MVSLRLVTGAEACRHGLQQLVADRMTKGIVHGLEVLEVDAVDRDRNAALRPLSQRVDKARLETRPVGELRQRIVVGHLLDARLGLVMFEGDGANMHTCVDDAALERGRAAVACENRMQTCR